MSPSDLVKLSKPQASVIEHLRLLAQDVAPVARARISSALVYRKEIIAIGVCRYKTHPLQQRFSRNVDSIFLHAEIDAISNARRRLRNDDLLADCSLYVMRQKFDKSGVLVDGLACPCDGCRKAINKFRINSVWWSDNDV